MLANKAETISTVFFHSCNILVTVSVSFCRHFQDIDICVEFLFREKMLYREGGRSDVVTSKLVFKVKIAAMFC